MGGMDVFMQQAAQKRTKLPFSGRGYLKFFEEILVRIVKVALERLMKIQKSLLKVFPENLCLLMTGLFRSFFVF
jgi:hypothetical protein